MRRPPHAPPLPARPNVCQLRLPVQQPTPSSLTHPPAEGQVAHSRERRQEELPPKVDRPLLPRPAPPLHARRPAVGRAPGRRCSRRSRGSRRRLRGCGRPQASQKGGVGAGDGSRRRLGAALKLCPLARRLCCLNLQPTLLLLRHLLLLAAAASATAATAATAAATAAPALLPPAPLGRVADAQPFQRRVRGGEIVVPLPAKLREKENREVEAGWRRCRAAGASKAGGSAGGNPHGGSRRTRTGTPRQAQAGPHLPLGGWCLRRWQPMPWAQQAHAPAPTENHSARSTAECTQHKGTAHQAPAAPARQGPASPQQLLHVLAQAVHRLCRRRL